MGWLVRTLDREIQVRGLLLAELSQLDVELSKMCASDLFIQLLGKHVNTKGELLRSGPESDLGQNLVRERTRHDEGGMASSTAENYQVNYE